MRFCSRFRRGGPKVGNNEVERGSSAHGLKTLKERTSPQLSPLTRPPPYEQSSSIPTALQLSAHAVHRTAVFNS